MRRMLLIIALILAVSPAIAADHAPIKSILSNGLTLIIKPEPESKIVAIEVFVRMGASDEDEATQGIGHVLAGSILGGTKSRSPRQFTRLFSEVGGSFQASWQWDYLEIYGVTVPEMCDEAITLLADSIQQSAFRPDVVEYARSAILSQARTAEAEPFNAAYTNLRKALYGDGPYKRPFIGSPDVIERVTQRDVEALYQRCFLPNQMVISIAGKVNPDAVSRKVLRLFGNMTYRQKSAPSEQSPPSNVVYVTKNVGSATYLMLGFPAADINSADYPALSVANVLLGANKSSFLFRKLREEMGIGYQVGSMYPGLRGPGHIVAYVGMDAQRATPEALELAKTAMMEQVARLREGKFTDDDLERAKRYLIGTHAIKHERVRDRAYYPGWYEVMGRGYQYDPQYAEDIRKVAREDVVDVAGRYLGVSVTALGPAPDDQPAD